MKRIALMLGLMGLPATSAFAAPWEYQGDYYGHEAWQGSADGENVLAFTCGDDAYDGAFYIATSEPYEATTSYADEVPATFTLDGKTVSVSGVFEDRAGNVGVYFEYNDATAPHLDQLFSLIVRARGDIGVKFFDKSMVFSSEGAAAAINIVANGPTDCNPY